jgi:Ti-type conjugative transfer relaxase TraA
MIIKGRARTNPKDLAAHLLRSDENEQVKVIELRDVAGSNLHDALCEMDALKMATRAEKGLYHAMINTRADERLSDEQWRQAVDALEARLGFSGQPRAVVKHVKEGREHWHVVWSRTDLEKAKAIPVSHNYRAHEEVARALELAFGHARVEGAHVGREDRARPDRTPYPWEVQQQARTKISIKEIEAAVKAAWEQADGAKAFQNALEHRGLILAQGDKRSFVVVDSAGGVHSLARRLKTVKAADLRAQLSTLETLPTVHEARELQKQRSRARDEAGGTLPLAPAPTLDEVEGELLGTRSYFTRGQLEGLLADKGHQHVRTHATAILKDERLLRLTDPASGRFIGYTTRHVRTQELNVLANARALASDHRHRLAGRSLKRLFQEMQLSGEQQAALRHALEPGALKLIEGRAGTGKSFLLKAIRLAAEADGYEVIGLAPTNTVAADLGKSGFKNARTVHSLLWWRENRLSHINAKLSAKSLIVVDEAAMLGTKVLDRLLNEVRESGAKLIMVGDSRQLQSVERGGMFRDLSDEFGSASLSEVRRQRESWARGASEAFAEGKFKEGLAAYEERGLIRWSDSLDEARQRLVTAWEQDTAEMRGERFVFAYTNKEVDALNEALHNIEVERGRIGNAIEVETTRGLREIGEGDRVQFRANDKPNGVFNGALGTVTGIEGRVLSIETDAGATVEVDTREFKAIDHGYAGTIYRGQGKTLDQSYVLHTRHWRDASSYVAMSRAREDTQMFVAQSQARDLDDLAWQMGRRQSEGSTLSYSAEPVSPDHAAGNAKAAFDEQARMATELRDGLERLKLEARHTEGRMDAAEAHLEAESKVPASEIPRMRAQFAAQNAERQSTASDELSALDARQDQTRPARRSALSDTFEKASTGLTSPSPAQETHVDKTAHEIAVKFSRDRQKGRGERGPL